MAGAGFETSNEMYINMRPSDIPEWIKGRHFFEQPLSTIQFWEEQKRILHEGIRIQGYWVHPMMYYHLNFFKTPLPAGKGEDEIQSPKLDDLFYIFIESYKRAQEENKAVMLFGTRGSSKSTLSACLTGFTITTTKEGNFSIVGGNSKDLQSIGSLIQKNFLYQPPALVLPTIKNDWNSHVVFGFKDKETKKNIVHSEIMISNVNDKNAKESEQTAGLSPIGYIADEVGKYDFLDPLKTAQPGFKNKFGYRFVPLLCGTTGNEKLSKQAKKAINNPDAFDILVGDWDLLSQFVPPGDDLRQDFGQKSCTFMPGQMSHRLEGSTKIEKTLAEIVKVDDPFLKKIPFYVSDWEKTNTEIQAMVDSNDREVSEKARMYYPRRLSDMFLTQGTNPFNKRAIERRIQYLEENGTKKKLVDIYIENNKPVILPTGLRTEEVGEHYEGEAQDAPVAVFGEIPTEIPEKYIHAGGLDDYKLRESTTQSWGSYYIVKRRNTEINEPCETITASYTARPEQHATLHNKVENMAEAWHAETLLEYVDVLFEDHLIKKRKDAKLLAPAIKIESGSLKNNTGRKYGMASSPGNKEYRMKVVIDWTFEEVVLSIDEEGNTEKKYTVDFIDDLPLLYEMRDYRQGGNYDRLDAFSHALVLCRYWDDNNIQPKSLRKKTKIHAENATEKAKLQINTYGRRLNKNLYGRRK